MGEILGKDGRRKFCEAKGAKGRGGEGWNKSERALDALYTIDDLISYG